MHRINSLRTQVRWLGMTLFAACGDPCSPGLAIMSGSDASSSPRPAQESSFDAGSEPSGVATDASSPAGSQGGEDSAPARSARVSLIDSRAWSVFPSVDDPFADQPATVACPAAGYMAESLGDEPVFSVDTGKCNYITVQQSTRFDVPAGSVLQARIWHFELLAEAPAEAHAAVRVGDLSVLDQRVAIPAAGGLLLGTAVVAQLIPAGSTIYFHLHNHGANSWSMVELSAGTD